jgi:hypothetical protein
MSGLYSQRLTLMEHSGKLARYVGVVQGAKAMTHRGSRFADAVEPHLTRATREPNHRLRLLIVMAHGPAGVLPEAWRSFARIEDARASASEALRNPQVLRVAIVEDGAGLIGLANALRLVEWVV